jgi:hypothetical protein
MFDELLQKVKNNALYERDLAVDNLSTLLEYDELSNSDQIYIVEELIKVLHDESNVAVVESIFNLFGIAFANDTCSNGILEATIGMLNNLETGSLVHAIPIISNSTLPNKESLIEPFLNSESPPVRSIADEELQMIRKVR